MAVDHHVLYQCYIRHLPVYMYSNYIHSANRLLPLHLGQAYGIYASEYAYNGSNTGIIPLQAPERHYICVDVHITRQPALDILAPSVHPHHDSSIDIPVLVLGVLFLQIGRKHSQQLLLCGFSTRIPVDHTTDGFFRNNRRSPEARTTKKSLDNQNQIKK